MLKITNLSYKNLFSNINLEQENGVIGIYGPSGSGKTTFLKTVGGYIFPYDGNIYLNGENIEKNIIKYRKNNGFSFQSENLLDLDIESNLQLPFLFGKTKIDKNYKNELIKYFEVEKIIGKNIENISGGEKQRISIIKAFIHKPNIVLLDEADSSLDDKLKNKFYYFLIEQSKNRLIFLISHDMNSIKKLNLNNKIYDGNFSILM